MNEEKKTLPRVRIHLLDVVLILLAILCIVGVWQRSNLKKLFSAQESMDAYTVTFEIAQLSPTVVDDYLSAGVELYMDHDGDRVSLGTLSRQASTGAATKYLKNNAGETVSAIYYPEDLRSVRGVLSSHGLERDGSFYISGDVLLSVNETVVAYTEHADFEIRITGIEKVT